MQKIMLSESFRPQVQAYLLNYTQIAKEFDINTALQQEMAHCPCKSVMWILTPEDSTADGHVVSVNTAHLR